MGSFLFFGLLSSSAVIFFIYLYVLLKEYIYCVLDFAFFSCRLKLHKGLLIF